MKLPGFVTRLRRYPPRRLRLGLWGARLAMLLLFAGFTLALTAGLVYAANHAILPENHDGISASAHNRCIERFRPRTRAYRQCIRTEPPPPAEDAWPFLRAGAVVAGAGLVLTVASARGRALTVIPAIALAGLTVVATMEANRAIEEERAEIDRLKTPPPSPEPTEGS